MRVAIDLDRCQDNGVCVRRSPDVFAVRDDATVVVVEEPRRELHPSVRDAARRCPTRAITVEG